MGGFGGQGNQNTGFNNQPLQQEGAFNTQVQGGNFNPQAKYFYFCLYPQGLCMPMIFHQRSRINRKFYDYSGHEIAPNTGANATKFFTLATKS